MSVDAAVYLDSSALVKLVVAESESAALRRYLGARPLRVCCALAKVEIVRAVREHGRDATRRAREVLGRTHLLHLDDQLLNAAAALDSGVLRGLDAIHLAAAGTFGDGLEAVVTYDRRMTDAAARVGLAVAAPT